MAPKLNRAKSKKKVNLASVLVQTDMECLLSDLKTLQNERPTTVSNKAELQALCVPLQKIATQSEAWSSTTLQLLIQLLRALPADFTEQLAKVILDSSLLSLLSQAFDKLLKAVEDGTSVEQSGRALMVVLQAVEDLSFCQYKGTGSKGIVHGKDRCGLFVDRAVAAAVSSKLGMLPRRHAVRLLLQLVTKSQSNTEALFNLESVHQDLFASGLRQCGDFCIQADLTEVMYRGARQGFTQGADAAFQNHPAAKAMFGALVQRPVREVDSTGLAKELRKLVNAYNSSCGPHASVRTFTATEISIGQASTVQPAEGKWVDVGQEHLSIAILLPDLDQDSDDPPPDILDVVYSNIAAFEAKSLAGNDARRILLKLRLKKVPDVLTECWDPDDGTQAVSCTFDKADLDQVLAVIKKAVPHLFRPPPGKPVHDSQDSFFELKAEPKVKMSMTRQTLSFKPTTVDGHLPGPQKGSLHLQLSAHKTRPSGGSVLQVKHHPASLPGSAKEAFEKTAAEHLALAASNLTAKPSSSIQHSKDTGPRNAKMAQAVAVQQSNADDHAADSPTLGQQAALPAQSSRSQESGSSSEPSDEVLDDPTHNALSQRPHAHLPVQPQMMPHGDALVQTGHADDVQLDTAEAHAPLPNRQLPKSGQWMSKQGSGQSAAAKQANQASNSSARMSGKLHHRGTAATLKANSANLQLHCSLLYAASEGENSDCESSPHALQPVQGKESMPKPELQQQPKLTKPPLPKIRQKPGQAKLQGDAEPASGRARQAAAASRTKGAAGKPVSKSTDQRDGAVDGFDLMSEEDRLQPEPSRAKQVLDASNLARSHLKSPAEQTSKADGTNPTATHTQQKLPLSRGRQHSKRAVTHDINTTDKDLLEQDEKQQQAPAVANADQRIEAAQPIQRVQPQVAAAQEMEAAHGSAQDPDWLAIAEKVLDAENVPQDTFDTALASPAAHSPAPMHTFQPRQKHNGKNKSRQHMDPEDRQPSPKAKASKHEKLPCKHTLQLQPADESDTAREEAMPAAPAQKSAQGTRKQNKPEKAAKVGSKTHTKEPDNSRDKHEDVPATCNNMPVKIQPKKVPQKKHPSAQLEDRHSEDSQLASSADAQQHRHHHRNEKKRQAGKAMKNALDYMADSESEPDDYIPTQFRAAAGMAAQKPASKKIAAVQSKPTGRAKQPVQEKEAKVKKPAKAVKDTLDEGQPKRPRGRPRKAPQEQQPPKQKPASKRKAFAAAAAAAADADKSDSGADAEARRPKQKAKKATKTEVAQQQHQEDNLQEQDSEPQSSGLGVELSSPRPQGLFQLPAKTERHQPRLQHGLQQQPASPGHEAAYDMGDDDDGAYMPEEQLEISLGAGYAEKRDTPHVPANIHKSGAPKSREHSGGFIPFLSAVKPAPTLPQADAEDIEVELDLQQALVESMAGPSPSKGLHSKGNALRDISNWRLPVQADKPRAAAKGPPLLAALHTGGAAGQRQKAADLAGDQPGAAAANRGHKKVPPKVAAQQQLNAANQSKARGGQRKAVKAKQAALLESDSEEEAQAGPNGGASLEGVLQHMVQGLNSQDGDSDEEGSELADLQRVLQRVVSSKKASARQKQAAIVQDVQDRIDNMGTELSKALKKDLQESGMLCQAQYSELCSQLADRKAEITAKTAAYQKEVQGMWEGYKEMYSRMEPMRQELTVYMQKKNAGNKRKLAEMQQEAEQLMADAERKLAKTQSKAAKLPALAKMLKAFV